MAFVIDTCPQIETRDSLSWCHPKNPHIRRVSGALQGRWDGWAPYGFAGVAVESNDGVGGVTLILCLHGQDLHGHLEVPTCTKASLATGQQKSPSESEAAGLLLGGIHTSKTRGTARSPRVYRTR